MLERGWGHWFFALCSQWGCVPGHWAGVQRGLGILFQDGGRDGTENHQLWDSLRKKSFLHPPRGAV